MKFLIDECLTANLVLDAGQGEHKACHLVRLNKAGWPDRNIVPFAIDSDFILATNNASDFRQLYAKQPIHPGLIIILPNVERPMQRRLFRAALAKLKAVGELVNRVFKIGLDGNEISLTVYDLSTGNL